MRAGRKPGTGQGPWKLCGDGWPNLRVDDLEDPGEDEDVGSLIDGDQLTPDDVRRLTR